MSEANGKRNGKTKAEETHAGNPEVQAGASAHETQSAFGTLAERGMPLSAHDASITADPELTVDVPDSVPPEEREAYALNVIRVRKLRAALPPMGHKLALPSRPGYFRHWANDRPGRIEQLEIGGWTFIKDRKGDNLKQVVGSGRDNGALYAYAMEIPIIFFEDIMAEKHRQASEKMDAVKRDIQIPQGVAKASDEKAFYSKQETPVRIRETLVKAQPV